MFKTGIGKIKGKLITTVVILVVVAAAGYGGWKYFYSNSDTTTAKALTAEVTKGSIAVTVSGTGAVQPSLNRNIASTVAGTLSNMNFTNGGKVTKGQLLFQLSSDSLQTELKKANIALQQSQLEYSKLQKELQSQPAYAPISGKVTQLDVENGQDVQKDGALMVLTDTSKLTATIPFNPAQVAKIKVGQKAQVNITSMFYTMTGRVKKVDRVGQPTGDGSVLHDVTVEVSNPGSLAPGLVAQATINTGKGYEVGYSEAKLEWGETETVKAGAAGTLTLFNIEENTYVKKGQRLARVYSDDLATQITSQQLKVEQARLDLSEAQKKLADCSIYAPDSGIMTLNEVDTGSGNSGGGSGSSSSSSGSSSSSSSTGSEIYYQVGDEVSSGEALATLTSSNGMKVDVSVDEVDIAKIKVGQTANVTVDALTDKKFTGKVTGIGSKGTESNGVASFDVTVSIPSDPALKENMTANVEINVAQKDGVLLLPVEAVQERGDRKFVSVPVSGSGSSTGATGDTGNKGSFSGNSAGQTGSNRSSQSGGSRSGRTGTNRAVGNGQARMVTVKVGLYNETMIEITSGLKEGDVVNLPTVAKTSSSSGSTSANGSNSGNKSGGMGGFGGGGFPGGGR